MGKAKRQRKQQSSQLAFEHLVRLCQNPRLLIQTLSDVDRKAFNDINSTNENFDFRIKVEMAECTRYVTIHVKGDLVMTEIEPIDAVSHRLPVHYQRKAV
jgi:hypothetical protein